MFQWVLVAESLQVEVEVSLQQEPIGTYILPIQFRAKSLKCIAQKIMESVTNILT